jgi:hypothetical protein
MSTHTPGPWVVRNDGRDYPCPLIDAESVGTGHYASIAIAIQRDPHPQHRGGIDAATAAANARLIAAAPELLNALLLIIEEPSHELLDVARNYALEVIAKAEGKA